LETPSLLGVGLYTLADAARLLHVPRRNLLRWLEGYSLAPEGEAGNLVAANGERLLTFADLIELKFVALFRREGVSLPTIRVAAQDAVRQFGTAHPFALRKFHTDGKRLFATMQQERSREGASESLLLELARGQMVIEDVARPFFRQLEYNGEEVMLLRPLGPSTCVILDPRRAFGKPIDEASGVPTRVLYQMVRGGETKERVARWHNTDLAGVADAIEFESSLEKAA